MSKTCEKCGMEFEKQQAWIGHQAASHDKPYHDKERLREKYVEEGLKLREIADEWDCSDATILRQLQNFGIETRERGNPRTPGVKLLMNNHGHMYWRNTSRPDKGRTMMVHRLLAIAELGVDAVAGNDVHHDNEVPWDNRPANLVVMSDADHARHHSTKYNDKMKRRIALAYEMTDYTLAEIAEHFDITSRTVARYRDSQPK